MAEYRATAPELPPCPADCTPPQTLSGAQRTRCSLFRVPFSRSVPPLPVLVLCDPGGQCCDVQCNRPEEATVAAWSEDYQCPPVQRQVSTAGSSDLEGPLWKSPPTEEHRRNRSIKLLSGEFLLTLSLGSGEMLTQSLRSQLKTKWPPPIVFSEACAVVPTTLPIHAFNGRLRVFLLIPFRKIKNRGGGSRARCSRSGRVSCSNIVRKFACFCAVMLATPCPPRGRFLARRSEQGGVRDAHLSADRRLFGFRPSRRDAQTSNCTIYALTTGISFDSTRGGGCQLCVYL
ncbi:hypothetical protein Zmor_000699 [Zophobas morio]|uniref:Uncharacterized protein n=1 Tax=Zophobas morio TaxID=2755281 RepID=A0AA38IWX2_9CUCU|nr:hypothetical protein Zmor_000699 [Zophobas morio]